MLYYIAFAALSLLAYFRPGRRPGARLKLKGGWGINAKRDYKDIVASLKTGQALQVFSSSSSERTLNVVFNYNGHSWDAYEVLGIPAGSAATEVEAAFERAMGRVDEPSRPFIVAARAAILDHLSAQRKAN